MTFGDVQDESVDGSHFEGCGNYKIAACHLQGVITKYSGNRRAYARFGLKYMICDALGSSIIVTVRLETDPSRPHQPSTQRCANCSFMIYTSSQGTQG